MKKLLRSQKFCAALVIIAWLATLVAGWGVLEAGRTVAQATEACQSKDLREMGIRLELACSPDKTLRLLHGDTKSSASRMACIRSGTAAQVRADYLLIPAHSGLTLALFLFVRSLWITPSRERKSLSWGLLASGLLLAVAMLIGDVVENLKLTAMIKLTAEKRPLPSTEPAVLCVAGHLKWAALAASALLLALLWKAKSSPRLVWVLRLLGLAAAALFLAGLARPDWKLVSWGVDALSAFWLTALAHAAVVAAEPEPVQIPRPLTEGKQNS